MAISAAAKSHHDQLFGDRVSTLAQSDPELIGYFGNFAFDEVHADAARLDETLDLHTRLMVQLAAILAAGGLARAVGVHAADAPGARQDGAGPHCRRRRGGRSPHGHLGG
jgi:4-carboxymuconolactone decarboxylase